MNLKVLASAPMPQKAQLIALDTLRATDAVSDKKAESLNTIFSALAQCCIMSRTPPR
jgi:hypothetical protein